MMKHIKKTLSLIMVLCMVFSLTLVNVPAAEAVTDTETTEQESVAETDSETIAGNMANVTENKSDDDPSDGTMDELKADKDISETDTGTVTDNEAVLYAAGSNEKTTAINIEKTKSVPLADASFYKIFHLDAGRKYFSLDQIKEIIDFMSANDYNALELAVGNDGLRFLLSDMSVSANGHVFSSGDVKAGIQKGNKTYHDEGAVNELTQTEMDAIIDYAEAKGITVIPLINLPGHMDAILSAMVDLAIPSPAYKNSKTTIDVTNAEAVNFTMALAQKYIQYFAGKGCTIFNMGADEYANDVSTSNFAQMSADEYAAYVNYVNNMAAQIQNAGMTAMAFNDGIYYQGDTSHGTFDTDIAVAYWNGNGTSAADLAEKGFKIINTNNNWYYVLGANGSGWAGYDRALANVEKTKVTTMIDGSSVNPAGSMLCIWCDNPEVEYSDTEVDRISNLMTTQAASNPTYFTLNREMTITIPVYGTYTVEVDNEDVTIGRDALNENIAVVGNPQQAEETGYIQTDTLTSGKQYLLVNQGSLLTTNTAQYSNVTGLNCTAFDASEDNNAAYLWTVTEVSEGYTLQNEEGKYLNIANSGGNANVTLTDTPQTLRIEDLGSTFAISDAVGTYLDRFNSGFAAGWGGDGAGTTNQNEQWALYEYKNGYEVTISGVGIGETQVVIGDTTYYINVIEEDLSQVEPLTITRYLSTYRVYNVENHDEGNIVSVSAEQANFEEGIAIANIVPEKGWWEWAGTDIETVFWKGVVLDNIDQGATDSIDYSMRGTNFYYIRYWGGNWQYSENRSDWTSVKSTDYANAYYLQKTEVTSEVDTYVKDWAFTTRNSTEVTEKNRYQKALSFGVVYPNGSISPATEADIYTNSTLIYWDNLADLGFIRIGTNEVYEVEKITYTFGTHDQPENINWTSEDSITWEKINVAGTENQWYDETVCWDESYGTEPVVDGAALNNVIYAGTGDYTNYAGTWGANDAILILIYLKPIQSEDSLTVQYWDDSTDSEIYNYLLNISNTSTEEQGTFLNRLQNDGNTVAVGEITLSDNAYVVNAKGVQEGFEKDLTKISALRGKYTSGLYNYIKAEISSDGKTLILHYNLDSKKLQPYYIADFGLPVEIPFDDLGTGVISATATVPSTANGTVSVSNENKKIVFTAAKAYSGVTVLSVTATYEDNETQMFNVGIYPATTVYYEESFATGDFGLSGNASNTNQQALAYGNDSDRSNAYNYGYDAVYADDGVMASNGTQASSTVIGDDAVFTFTGTGVDIYANCTTSTGSVNIMVRDSANSLVKLLKVDTKTGTAGSETEGQNVDSYSLPIASLNGLPRDTYTVTIRHCKSDANETESGAVYLDGFKVFGTIDVNSSVYAVDSEQNPNYTEVRNSVLKALNVTADTSEVYANKLAEQIYSQIDGQSGAIIISANDAAERDAQDLLDNGPKNEIFLRPAESLVFTLGSGITSAQIGLKAVNAEVTYIINGSNQTMNTSTDMFYKLNASGGNTVTITNESGGILSVTDLKWFGNLTSEVVMDAPSEEAVGTALMSLGFEAEPTEPEVTYADAALNIVLNDESGNVLNSTCLSENGVVGENAVFAAEDIEAAVTTMVPEGYELDAVSYSDIKVAYGETEDVEFTAYVKKTESETKPEENPSQSTDIWYQIFAGIKDFLNSLFGRH